MKICFFKMKQASHNFFTWDGFKVNLPFQIMNLLPYCKAKRVDIGSFSYQIVKCVAIEGCENCEQKRLLNAWTHDWKIQVKKGRT